MNPTTIDIPTPKMSKLGNFFSAVGGAIPILGSVISGIFSSRSAKKQMAFQERMASTQHQREVADLRAAGLNPILSATGGSGAASPSGASVEFDSPGAEAVSSALAAARAKEEIKSIRAERQNVEEDTDLKRATSFVTRETEQRVKAEAEVARTTAKLLGLELVGAGVEADIDRSVYGRVMRYLNRFSSSSRGVASSIADVGEAVAGGKVRSISRGAGAFGRGVRSMSDRYGGQVGGRRRVEPRFRR